MASIDLPDICACCGADDPTEMEALMSRRSIYDLNSLIFLFVMRISFKIRTCRHLVPVWRICHKSRNRQNQIVELVGIIFICMLLVAILLSLSLVALNRNSPWAQAFLIRFGIIGTTGLFIISWIGTRFPSPLGSTDGRTLKFNNPDFAAKFSARNPHLVRQKRIRKEQRYDH